MRSNRVRDTANLFGGSHAQRDLLTLTLIDASIRAGDGRRAQHYIAERLMHKPTAWSERLLMRSRRGTHVGKRDHRIDHRIRSAGNAVVSRCW